MLERDADGFAAFRGAYRDGVRHGEGALAQPDGGLLLAEWVDGELWRDSVGETRPGDASPNAEWSPFAFAYPSRYDDDAFEDVPSLASAPSSARNDEETRSSAFDALRPPFTRAVLYGAWRRNDRAAGAAADGESARCRVAGFYPGRAEATEADAEAFERWLDTRETHPDPTERGGGGGGRAPPRPRPGGARRRAPRVFSRRETPVETRRVRSKSRARSRRRRRERSPRAVRAPEDGAD